MILLISLKKTDFDNKLKNLNQKITLKETKHIFAQNEFDSSFFIGKSYFNNDGAHFYLILQPLYYSFKRLVVTEKVLSWKSKGLPTK